MQRRKTNRLLAGLLALVMLLSLCEVTMGQSASAEAAVTLQNPATNENGVTTWDSIYFGNYWQNDTNGDGKVDQNDKKEPIKWRVLSVNGNDVFLLADQNLDAKPYNQERTDVTWATCTLRTWLNDTFLNSAFTSAEQNAIKNTTVVNDDNPHYGTEGGENTTDKVYLLSIAEASNTAYGFDGDFLASSSSKTRAAKNTAYAKECGAYTEWTMDYEGNGFWFLRSPGGDSEYAARVGYDGRGRDYGDCVDYGNAVRPALHLNVSSSSLWSYAGKVPASAGGGSSQVTSTPAGGSSQVTSTPAVIPSAAPDNSDKISGKKTLSKVSLQVPKNKKGKKLVICWNAVKDAGGYQLQYALNKKFKKKKSIQTGKIKYTIKKLKKKKTYYIRVRAYKMNGKKKIYGKWSKVKKVKIKK